MKSLIKKYNKTIVGGIIGAALGYAYYYFIGCSNGTCAITSNQINSTLYGAFMGGLLGSSFKNESQTKTSK